MNYQLVYCSRNRIPGSQQEVAAEIDSILVASRRNNAANDVTGALLFNGEAFAQVLEGPRDSVDITYAKLRFDARHSNVILLQQANQLERDFGIWTMAYSDARFSALELPALDLIEADPEGFAGEMLRLLKAVVDAHAAKRIVSEMLLLLALQSVAHCNVVAFGKRGQFAT